MSAQPNEHAQRAEELKQEGEEHLSRIDTEEVTPPEPENEVSAPAQEDLDDSEAHDASDDSSGE